MKFSFAAIALVFTSSLTQAEAAKLKSTAQMQAEIEAMSMNTNMHQVSLREKTLLKTYLEVDLNEFIQQKMDSELFEGVDEQHKSEFVGNFFHFVKCRFQDCGTNLAQTKNKNKQKSPTAAESKTEQDAKELTDWGSGHANHVQAWHTPKEYKYAQTGSSSKSPSAAESKTE